MAVEVMRTIASRGFRILGSGTSSTRTSVLPYQQVAFIENSPFVLLRWAARQATTRGSEFCLRPNEIVVFAGCTAGPSSRLAFSARDLASFNKLLETVQIHVDLLFRVFTKKLGHGGPKNA